MTRYSGSGWTNRTTTTWWTTREEDDDVVDDVDDDDEDRRRLLSVRENYDDFSGLHSAAPSHSRLVAFRY